MIKTKIIKFEQIGYEYFCDICKDQVNEIAKCCLCGKDACRKCFVEIFEESDASDNTEFYCNQCYEIYEKYQITLKDIKREYDNKIKIIEDEMMKEITTKNLGT